MIKHAVEYNNCPTEASLQGLNSIEPAFEETFWWFIFR